MTTSEKKQLMATACKVRMGAIKGVHAAKAGHPGGSLSAADLFTYLYFRELRIDPKNPKWEDRDRFVLSKGHTAPGLYAALALRGYFPEEDLLTLRQIGSHLQGHPNMNLTPGVDMSTGSLGQGVSTAAGMALAAKYQGKDCRVYTLLGDGEIRGGRSVGGIHVCPPLQSGQPVRHHRQQRPPDRRPGGGRHESLSHPRETAGLRLPGL